MLSKLRSIKSSLHLKHFRHSSKGMKDEMAMEKKEPMMDDMSMSTAPKSDGMMSPSDMSSDMSNKDMSTMSSKDGMMMEGENAMTKGQDGAMPMKDTMSSGMMKDGMTETMGMKDNMIKDGMNESMAMKDDMMKKDMAMETDTMNKADMTMENGTMKKDGMAMESGMMKNDNMGMDHMSMDKSAAMSNAMDMKNMASEMSADMMKKPEPQVAIFGAGCFWGTEHMFLKHYPPKENKGIISTSVGTINGVEDVTNPSKDTMKGAGSAEACRVVFDPSIVSYAELVEFFYRFHDPTMLNHQGNDKGKDYRSAIFTISDEQVEIARRVSAEVQAKHFDPKGQTIVTKIETAGSWRESPAHHQQYLSKNPNGYHCYTHKLHW